ncbi:DUF5694 domain-containing protein [Salinimicrobium xinjiangense]|uniref:DUF5694 domain-containing protein n=1 Tax=Salinimicrobium xinjiangense TaxID=438596 RepID=UPI00040E6529|nr:DUF5694 domain-containing protein [Salinimicrobium xinjiangense]
MKILLSAAVFFLVCLKGHSQEQPTEILLLGSDHLTQVYNSNSSNTDVFTEKNQQGIAEFVSAFKNFRPDMVMVENLPEEKPETDSLYRLYQENQLNLTELEYGRSEVFQIAFRIASEAHLEEIFCVDAPGGTSHNILKNGKNIAFFNSALQQLGSLAGEKKRALAEGDISLKEYLTFLNQPEAYKAIYNVRYIAPARVTHGTFTNPDERVPVEFINNDYIGAELISVFKNRDYKIYSNIVTNVMEKEPQRIVLVIGVGHIGSLRNILRDDPEFKVIDANQYLKL